MKPIKQYIEEYAIKHGYFADIPEELGEIIQLDAFIDGERFAAEIVKGNWDSGHSKAILTDANNRTELP